MKTNTNPVAELNIILSKTFGGATRGMIARSPIWGHSDNCWIIYGEKAAIAAKLLAVRMNAKLTKEVTGLGETFKLEWRHSAAS